MPAAAVDAYSTGPFAVRTMSGAQTASSSLVKRRLASRSSPLSWKVRSMMDVSNTERASDIPGMLAT